MRKSRIQTLRSLLLSAVMTAVLLVAVGGPWYLSQSGSDMDHGDGLAGCPFQGMAALCPMNVFSHVALWRSTAAAIVPSVIGIAMLMLVFVICWSRWRREWLLILVKKKYRDRRIFFQPPPHQIARGTLRWAFARGILHPKIYLSTIA